MTRNLRRRIEEVLDEKVRPQLALHSGNIEIVELQDDVLKVRFLGKCSHCQICKRYHADSKCSHPMIGV